MQAKDVPDLPVLAFLSSLDRSATWFAPETYAHSVRHAMPPETPEKVALAKMRALIRRGLVEGCECGCRGDFVLTDKGRALLALRGGA